MTYFKGTDALINDSIVAEAFITACIVAGSYLQTAKLLIF